MNSEYDVVIENGDTRLCFKHLVWDSQFFDKTSYLLDMSQSLFGSRYDATVLQTEINEKLKGAFITAKIDTRIDHALLTLLQASGFYYVDTEVVLERALQQSPSESKPGGDVAVSELNDNVGLPYGELGSAFSLTRFHTDPYIDNTKADSLWINYLKNYRPDERRYLFAATVDGTTAGVFLVNMEEKVANLFFVAVSEAFRGKGVGKALVDFACSRFEGFTIKTETQVKNIGALNFYIKNGFSKIDKTMTVLHRWNNG